MARNGSGRLHGDRDSRQPQIFFYRDTTPAGKDEAGRNLTRNFATIAEQLGDKLFLLGDGMTIADPYLFWASRWTPIHGLALPEQLQSHLARMRGFPSVARALGEEGLGST